KSANATNIAGTYVPQRSQSVKSAYIELNAPFVSEKNAKPFLQALEFQVSARHDDYSTLAPTSVAPFTGQVGNLPVFNYQSERTRANSYTVALRLTPSRDIALRASFSTGFLPPSITQIVPGEQVLPLAPFQTGTFDSKRGGEELG